MAKKKTSKALQVPKPERGKKATEGEVADRITVVQNMLIDGHTRADVVRYGSENWGICSRQVDKYLSRAATAIKEINKVSLQENLAVITSQLWLSFRRARAASDERLALDVLKQLCKIKGLEQNTLHLVIDDKRELEDLSDQELEAMWTNTSDEDDFDDYDA